MNFSKDDVTLLKNVSGLDTEEIRLEQTINEMVAVLKGTRSDKKKDFLLNEINYRKRQLATIRKNSRNSN